MSDGASPPGPVPPWTTRPDRVLEGPQGIERAMRGLLEKGVEARVGHVCGTRWPPHRRLAEGSAVDGVAAPRPWPPEAPPDTHPPAHGRGGRLNRMEARVPWLTSCPAGDLNRATSGGGRSSQAPVLTIFTSAASPTPSAEAFSIALDTLMANRPPPAGITLEVNAVPFNSPCTRCWRRPPSSTICCCGTSTTASPPCLAGSQKRTVARNDTGSTGATQPRARCWVNYPRRRIPTDRTLHKP
jgi:hypothetical protein